MDIDAVDLVGVNRDNRPGDGFAADFVVEALALGEGAGLGVGKAVDAAVGIKDDGAGHHRTGEAAPAHFVDTRHRHEPVAVEGVLNVSARGNLWHSRHPYAL